METQEKQKGFINIIIGYIKDEILKSDIRTEIIKPILVYLLYYIIPFVIVFILLNFLATLTAVFLVFNLVNKKYIIYNRYE
jgi:hypothetical protein